MVQTAFRNTAIAGSLVLCTAALAWSDESRGHMFVLTVRKMDCPAESAPAVADLSRIPGIKNVRVDYKTVTLSITPKPNAFPSPLAIWESAERTKIDPVKLETARGTYHSKPPR